MSFEALLQLPRHDPLRIRLIHIGAPASLSLAGLLQPLRLAEQIVGATRLQISLHSLHEADASPAHISLLVADEGAVELTPARCQALAASWSNAAYWGGVGAAVLYLARAGLCDGLRLAFPWALYSQADALAERAILTPRLFELDGRCLSCCGGAASIDFALYLIERLYGVQVQATIKEALTIDQVRGPADRQHIALQARFGQLQPKLSEAVALMEANLEEPLATDDVAKLIGLSRRQLERLFKQYLGSVPSRYYLDLRLQRAKKLLQESNRSIVQIGLQCGFSSGSHFSTAYGTNFGIAPREERQRQLRRS